MDTTFMMAMNHLLVMGVTFAFGFFCASLYWLKKKYQQLEDYYVCITMLKTELEFHKIKSHKVDVVNKIVNKY